MQAQCVNCCSYNPQVDSPPVPTSTQPKRHTRRHVSYTEHENTEEFYIAAQCCHTTNEITRKEKESVICKRGSIEGAEVLTSPIQGGTIQLKVKITSLTTP